MFAGVFYSIEDSSSIRNRAVFCGRPGFGMPSTSYRHREGAFSGIPLREVGERMEAQGDRPRRSLTQFSG